MQNEEQMGSVPYLSFFEENWTTSFTPVEAILDRPYHVARDVDRAQVNPASSVSSFSSMIRIACWVPKQEPNRKTRKNIGPILRCQSIFIP